MNYFYWHYLYSPKRLLVTWENFLIFIPYFFSVKELIRHLFAPWKKLTLEKGPGWDPQEIARIISYNLVSRLVGATVRLGILLVGITGEIAAIIVFPVILVLWLLIPGLTLPFFLFSRPKEKEKLNFSEGDSPAVIFQKFLTTSQGKFFQKRLNFKDFSSLDYSIPLDLPFNRENLTDWFTIISFLAENWLPLKELLSGLGLDKKDIQNVLNWYEDLENERQRNLRFWWRDNLLSIKPVGRDLIYGYTLDLDKYSSDLTAPLPYSHHLVGRQKEARQIEQVLTRASENNVLLVGEPGVGRTTIVLNFARLVAEGRSDPILSHKRVLELNLNQILAQAKTPQEVKGITELILKQADAAGNIILVIKHIDLYLSTGEGRVNLTDVFAKFANRNNLQIIGITTPSDFQKYLYPNSEINKRFDKIEVSPPTIEEAYIILQRVAPVFEQRTRTLITYQAIKETIQKADQYLTDLPFPEKAIDLLDEVCVFVAGGKRFLVTKEDVDQLLSEKTKIPVGEIKKEEKEKLINLEKVLHQRIIDQEEAIKSIAKAMRRSRTGISAKNRPIGTFLFLGPTGVGKTETAKALAFSYFGAEERMIRFDMGEYQTSDALDKAIGLLATKDPGLFSKAIRENPFSLLLLDEIEKANPKFLNLLLTLLDEGYFTDAFGRKVDCRNLIIIATSNAGAEFIREKVANKRAGVNFAKEVTEYVLKQGIFTPEFLNRFDAVVVFRPLTPEHLQEIARLLLDNLNKRLKDKECSLEITPKLIERVAQLGYEPTFGARPMKRVIQDKIEDQIAQRLLKGEVKRGEKMKIEI